ncbi:MAG: 50S ribosomal protein L24 [Gemmatimonadetes bacterium]|nr:50S ribosomal protein L24 [Gemmatimonadota bacterium]
MKRNKLRIVKGDRVRIIRGNDRDREGVVLDVDPGRSRVRVEGVNVRKRHTAPSQRDPDGGIISIELPVHISNVMLIDSAGDASRTRLRISEDGTKQRISVRNGQPIPRPR